MFYRRGAEKDARKPAIHAIAAMENGIQGVREGWRVPASYTDCAKRNTFSILKQLPRKIECRYGAPQRKMACAQQPVGAEAALEAKRKVRQNESFKLRMLHEITICDFLQPDIRMA